MSKLQIWSHRFKIFFQILLILIPITLLAFWTDPVLISKAIPFLGPEYSINFAGSMPTIQNWDLDTRLLGLIISCIPISFTILILISLAQLFKLYEQGVIFTSANVKLIRKIGILMLIKELINPLYQILMTLTLSWSQGPGHRFINIYVSPNQLENIFISLLIILISWIMLEGSKLQEEQTYTV